MENVMNLTGLQIILICIYSGLAQVDSLTYRTGLNGIIMSGVITGIILNKVEIGLFVGALIQAYGLGLSTYKGESIPNFNAAAIITTIFATNNTEALSLSIALGMPVALIGMKIDGLIRMANSLIRRNVDKYVLEANIKRIRSFNSLGLFIWFIARAIMMALYLLVGLITVPYIVTYISIRIPWISQAFEVAAHILPAIAIAVILKFMQVKKYLAYLIVGFTFAAYLEMPTFGISLIGFAIALVVYKQNIRPEDLIYDEKIEFNQRYSDKQLKKLHRSHILNLQSSWNYERMQALGYLSSIIPVLYDSYGDNPQLLEKALRTHAQFYNTEPIMSDIIFGMNIALEEEGDGEDVIEITAEVKNAFMDPFAKVGDTIFGVIAGVILGSLAIHISLQNSLIGLLIIVAYSLFILFFVRPYLFNLGHKYAQDFLKLLGNKLDTFIKSASAYAITVIGGLIVTLVKVRFGGLYNIKESKYYLNFSSDVLDVIMPYFGSLLLVLMYYYLLKHKRVNISRLIIGTVIVILVITFIGVNTPLRLLV